MAYERSRRIEERFEAALALIKKRRLNSGELALELGISRPTAHRVVTELKRRGYLIRSVREEHGWCYELIKNSAIYD